MVGLLAGPWNSQHQHMCYTSLQGKDQTKYMIFPQCVSLAGGAAAHWDIIFFTGTSTNSSWRAASAAFFTRVFTTTVPL